ncbi:MAG: bifunctional glutamate N-acetyltransferase/amino-acid acetyltransferase ArgJ [Planctomycetaceae bacterium]
MSAAKLPELPLGFRAAGAACGIKSVADRLDLALFVSDLPATAAGVFTQNRVVGAPVKVSRGRVPRLSARGVVINSGNSNACTGERGVTDAEWMTATVADLIGYDAEDILVCSTGVIGRFLPRHKLEAGLPKVAAILQPTAESFNAAARGMMTTDTVAKQVSKTITLGGRQVTLAGACKGAAMIAPNMATMIAVLMTDAALPPALADRLLRDAVKLSFNAISVDGHTSTSDTVLLLANGASGASVDSAGDIDTFRDALTEVCQQLSQAIIRDAEGANHIVTVDISGLRTDEEALEIARTIADGILVKCALTGNDPNWGRIVSAAGYTSVCFEESDVSLWVNGVPLYEAGTPVAFDESDVSRRMATGEIHIDLRFTLGEAKARMWTSDLTQEYVRLNSEYTT